LILSSPDRPAFIRERAGYIAARLAAAGIGTMVDLDACTFADEEKFFSYRRMTYRGEADYGRHVNAIVLG
jgi:copper oxidase (laccase) domain-containing protein